MFDFVSSSYSLLFHFHSAVHQPRRIVFFLFFFLVSPLNIDGPHLTEMASLGISHDSLQTKERSMKAGFPHLPDAVLDNAAQVHTPMLPAPSSVIPSLGENNEPVSHKRKRQPYDPQRKSEVAAVRRVGACKDCQQKKIRASSLHIWIRKLAHTDIKQCLHALQPQPANGSTTLGTMLRLQNSTLQDFPVPPSLCSTSPVRSSDGSFLMTRVSPTSFKGANQFPPQKLKQFDRHIDSQNRSQMYAKRSAMQEGLTRPMNEAIPVLERVDQNFNPMFQRTVDSQTANYLRTGAYEQISWSPTSMPNFLGEDEPCDQTLGREMKQNSHSRYYETLQSPEAHRYKNLRDSAKPQTSPADYELLVTSSPFYGHRYHDIPNQISEVASIKSQTETPSLGWPNLLFAKSHSNSLGTNIAPGEFYCNSVAPEGIEALPPGSFDTRVLGNITNATQLIPLRGLFSQFSPAQDVRDEILQGSDQTSPLNPAYKDNSNFVTNPFPTAHRNTQGGYKVPLLRRTRVSVMPIGPHDVVSPQRVLLSEQNSNDPSNFTIPGKSADHNISNSNLTYVQSHDMPYYDFPSSDSELSKSLRSHPAAHQNYPPCQIRPYDEHVSSYSRPSLVPPNLQPGILPSVPQPQKLCANAATRSPFRSSTTSKKENVLIECEFVEEEGYGYRYD